MIDYNRIAEAIAFYTKQGFEYIEVPWAVDLNVLKITSPGNCQLFPLEDKFLVASAEQSFLQLISDGHLTRGKYMAVTPCFRDDSPSLIHQRYFVKLELIEINPGLSQRQQLLSMVEICKNQFEQYLPEIEVVTTSQGFDLCYKKIELGSYGIRTYLPGRGEPFTWIYGTGLAEPRLDYAISFSSSSDSRSSSGHSR